MRQQLLEPCEALSERIFGELKARIKPDDSSVPAPDGPFDYYVRFRDGGQHRLHCRRPRGGDGETILLDGDALARDRAYFQLGGTSHSPDHRLIAWSADDKGSEFYDVRVLDATNGDALRRHRSRHRRLYRVERRRTIFPLRPGR